MYSEFDEGIVQELTGETKSTYTPRHQKYKLNQSLIRRFKKFKPDELEILKDCLQEKLKTEKIEYRQEKIKTMIQQIEDALLYIIL